MVKYPNVENLIVPSTCPQDSFVQSFRINAIWTAQSQPLFQKRVGVVISCAQNDVVHFRWGTIFETHRVSLDIGQ